MKEKSYYVEFLEDKFIRSEKEMETMRRQLEYFGVEMAVNEVRVKNFKEEIGVNEEVIGMYEKLFKRYVGSQGNEGKKYSSKLVNGIDR